jgi:hypothetical protein
MLQNADGRLRTSGKYDLNENNRKEAHRRQVEQDRKEAQRQQVEEDRKIAQQLALQEKVSFFTKPWVTFF